MTSSDDNIKWFHQHVSLTYNMFETAVPMVDVAMYTIKHINRLFISHVSEKVKSDFFRIAIEYSKSNGNLVAFYIEPITSHLLDLIEDDEFNVDNFMTYHLSLPIGIPGQSSPLSNLLEQDTPLTSNLSELSKNVRSRQLQRISSLVWKCHEGTLPKDRDGMLVSAFASPSMWSGINGQHR
jgi:hypothetical protein